MIHLADVAGLLCDAVGVYCFTPVSPDQPTTYRAVPMPTHIELARVLFRAFQDLTALKSSRPIEPPSPSPAQAFEDSPPLETDD